MALAVNPRPSDGPLSAKGPTIKLTVTSSGGTMTVGIRKPTGGYLPIEYVSLAEGDNQVVLSLPPGGVPAGSTLILTIRDAGGNLQSVKYVLK